MHTYYEINFILINSLKLWISYHTPSKGIFGFQVRKAGIELMIFEYAWMIQDRENACSNLSLYTEALNSNCLIILITFLECGSGHLCIFLGSHTSMSSLSLLCYLSHCVKLIWKMFSRILEIWIWGNRLIELRRFRSRKICRHLHQLIQFWLFCLTFSALVKLVPNWK